MKNQHLLLKTAIASRDLFEAQRVNALH